MKMTASKLFIDSSIWLAYFLGFHPSASEIIEQKNVSLLTSLLSLFEIKRRLLQEKYSADQINNILAFIKLQSTIITLSEELCAEAAERSILLKLPAIDALIYTSAKKNNALLITTDSHFKGLENVHVFERL